MRKDSLGKLRSKEWNSPGDPLIMKNTADALSMALASKERSHVNFLSAGNIEAALKAFYNSVTPPPRIAYLFFLKDGDRYISVKVKTYRENLLKLNISPSCLKDCCWREYKYLVSVIEDIRTYIQNYIQDVPETLRSFVISMVDNITVYDGKVNSIVFRNGLTHKFVFKPTSS